VCFDNGRRIHRNPSGPDVSLGVKVCCVRRGFGGEVHVQGGPQYNLVGGANLEGAVPSLPAKFITVLFAVSRTSK
jgi:hypothetical protein